MKKSLYMLILCIIGLIIFLIGGNEKVFATTIVVGIIALYAKLEEQSDPED